ncbi:pyruvate oxidase [Dellaglioa carnosa]|uniref:Pyruvate oxidase n=1 Tax=Dellaglioa carnosa TaxID=2995136 RepID=A0ABT4JLG4_9LACO|nr:pyruvate oxidase [Dellaglioa carnosa]MCZ2491120.1 pyruvate oxidase [Dellaglioa carnosa]MCZ2494198.1 pyruvate oxidase [Dellaglioa carnosa]MDK1731386.1 pyruvate oxidase [Dellaglioa carnosa]
MSEKINASDAMLKVLEDWGVKTVYGLPGGSFDSTMNALHNRKDTINYVQVRHEEVGALAAAGEAKVTGKLGVAFGSAGPGAVHLLNGLYDAKYDGVPVLALVGQVGTQMMNTNYFQEMNENPMFEDVSVYNRTATTPENLPVVVDEAIRQAYKYNGVAVVTIPTDLGWQEIDDTFVSTATNYQKPLYPMPRDKQIQDALDILTTAKTPIIYAGKGIRGAGKELIALSEKLSLPIATSALAKTIIPDDYKAYMGSAGRVANKPGVDLLRAADAVLFIGSDFPFGGYFFAPDAKFIQVDIDSEKLGKRHAVDVPILADAKETLIALNDAVKTPIAPTKWYKASIANKENWMKWVESFNEDDGMPLRFEPVFNEINKIKDDDAIFQIDVGNATVEAMRFLRLGEKNKFTTSAWYATMGYALPAAIGAQSAFPDRQVFSISGDGGWTMVMQDVLTQVKYNMPIINVVLSNKELGFIRAEQDDKQQPHSGVDLIDADWGGIANNMGAKGYTVRTLAELKAAFAEAKGSKVPVVIDVKVTSDRPLPVEQLVIDSKTQDPEAVKAFVKEYQAEGLIPFREILENQN